MIAETKSSPQVECDAEMGRFIIKGSCYMSDAHDFFKPIIDWFDAYTAALKQPTSIHIQFAFLYINSTSSRFVLVLLKRILEVSHQKITLTIEWISDEDNEDTMDAGKDLEYILKIPFVFVTK